MLEKRTSSTTCNFVPRLLVALTALLLPAPAWATPTTSAGLSYVDECGALGVPVPPAWPSYNEVQAGNTLWQRFEDNFVLEEALAGLDNRRTEVYYWVDTSPEGVCIALPRIAPGEGIEALGVICQGKASGKACFWDRIGLSGNRIGLDQALITTRRDGDPDLGTQLPWYGGVDLVGKPGGVCTNCHRGQNAFIIHPESALGVHLPLRMPDVWYDPIIPEAWPENPEALTSPVVDVCTGCHHESMQGTVFFGGLFPRVTSEEDSKAYCSIFERAFGFSMPWPVPPGWPSPVPPDSPIFEGQEYFVYELLRHVCGLPEGSQTSPAPQKMMSFDTAAFWTAEVGSLLSVSGNQTEGEAAMAIDASGYVRLDSIPVRTSDIVTIGSQLDLDVFVDPQGQPEPHWLGAVQMYVSVPSAQIHNEAIGQLELTPSGTGWRSGSFTLPQHVLAALREVRRDVRFGIAAVTPTGAPPLLLDNLRFAGTLESAPTPPPELGVIHDFEKLGVWEGRDGNVVAAVPSATVGFESPMSLEIELNGSSEGRIWTTPSQSPEPGTQIYFRVYIPSDAPVLAISPYVMDAHWVWTDSWNATLPRDTWVTLTTVVPQTAALPLNQLGIKVYLSGPYSGPIYLDAVGW